MTENRLTAIAVVGKGNVRVLEIDGGWHIRQKLNQIGIHVGDTIQVKRSGLSGSPVLIHVHGTEMAIGKGMASKIIVQLMDL